MRGKANDVLAYIAELSSLSIESKGTTEIMKLGFLTCGILSTFAFAPLAFAKSTPATAAKGKTSDAAEPATKSPESSVPTEAKTSTEPAPASTESTPAASSTENAGSIDNTLSLFGILGYWYSGTGLGVGARYQKTLASRVAFKNNSIKDDFGIEFGADYLHYSFDYGLGALGNYDYSYNELAILAGLTWNVWFNDKLAVYPKLDIGYRIGLADTAYGSYGGLVIQGAAGVIYKLDSIALRAELGTGSLRLGVGLQL